MHARSRIGLRPFWGSRSSSRTTRCEYHGWWRKRRALRGGRLYATLYDGLLDHQQSFPVQEDVVRPAKERAGNPTGESAPMILLNPEVEAKTLDELWRSRRRSQGAELRQLWRGQSAELLFEMRDLKPREDSADFLSRHSACHNRYVVERRTDDARKLCLCRLDSSRMKAACARS